MTDLAERARSLVSAGKGILAADESVATAEARLASFGIAGGEEMRRRDRALFLNAPGVERYLSGVILFSETLDERGEDGEWFPASLAARGIAPGVKVDLGTEPFPESSKELITKGLLGLTKRLHEYRAKGAVFTKWRTVVRIEGDRLPSEAALRENAKRLASYARCAQEAGLVPVLEPEVLLAGKHSRARAENVIAHTLGTVFAALEEHAVLREAALLKTSMALSGSESGKRDTPEEVAEDTLAALLGSVPKDVAGVAFLSGGQTPEQATDNLAAICRLSRAERGTKVPWPLSFSFARALQEEALAVWKGEDANVGAAREVFLARLKKVSAAIST